jgi:hypothetical protein
MTKSIKLVSRSAPFSIRDKIDPDSNLTDERDRHSKKNRSPIDSTVEGITKSIKPVSKNAFCSIRHNFELFSNVTEENELHSAKQEELKTLTEAGIVGPSKSVR